MNLDSATIIGQIHNRTTIAHKTINRQAYLDTLQYLATIVPDLVVNDKRVAELDSNDQTGWPSAFVWVNSYEHLMVKDLITYKGIAANVFISHAWLYIKFPTVQATGYKISTYTKRRWRNTYSYSYPDNLDFELNAFRLGRVPTSEELQNGSALQAHTKITKHSVSISFTSLMSDIQKVAEEISKVHHLYSLATKRSVNYQVSSINSCHKAYLKLRGNAKFAAFNLANQSKGENVKT